LSKGSDNRALFGTDAADASKWRLPRKNAHRAATGDYDSRDKLEESRMNRAKPHK
jgi:hypothetical protein